MARAGGDAPLRNVLITGQPGVRGSGGFGAWAWNSLTAPAAPLSRQVGKTTLIAGLVEAIKHESVPMAGFTTEEGTPLRG